MKSILFVFIFFIIDELLLSVVRSINGEWKLNQSCDNKKLEPVDRGLQRAVSFLFFSAVMLWFISSRLSLRAFC
ncbi:hypothetical protein L0222_03365 [bacterium]|nr:hypothetical protein [bacterium]